MLSSSSLSMEAGTLVREKLYINGEWIDGEADPVDVQDPASGEAARIGRKRIGSAGEGGRCRGGARFPEVVQARRARTRFDSPPLV